MDFALSEERQMLKDTAERFVREKYPIETRHAAAKSEDADDLPGDEPVSGASGVRRSGRSSGRGGSAASLRAALGAGGAFDLFLPRVL